MRSRLAPNAKREGEADGRRPNPGGGSRLAGATIQKPVEASPDTKEQFFPHSRRRSSYHGRNGCAPLNASVWIGAGTVPVILEAEIDDQSRRDRHRRDQEDHRPAADEYHRPPAPDATRNAP